MLNENHCDGIWGKALDILRWENPKLGNIPFLISHGGSCQKMYLGTKMFATSCQCPTAKKMGTRANGSKWLQSLQTLSLDVGTLQARSHQQAGVLPNDR